MTATSDEAKRREVGREDDRRGEWSIFGRARGCVSKRVLFWGSELRSLEITVTHEELLVCRFESILGGIVNEGKAWQHSTNEQNPVLGIHLLYGVFFTRVELSSGSRRVGKRFSEKSPVDRRIRRSVFALTVQCSWRCGIPTVTTRRFDSSDLANERWFDLKTFLKLGARRHFCRERVRLLQELLVTSTPLEAQDGRGLCRARGRSFAAWSWE